MYFIGVDLGTSAVKLLLMDEEGKIVNIVSREYPLYFPHPGWSEQKPEDWWEQSKEGIRELVKDVDKSQVAGIRCMALSSWMRTITSSARRSSGTTAVPQNRPII